MDEIEWMLIRSPSALNDIPKDATGNPPSNTPNLASPVNPEMKENTSVKATNTTTTKGTP